MDEIIYKGFECWTQSEKRINKLAEEVCKHLSSTKPELKLTPCNGTESSSVEREKRTEVLKEQTDSSSLAFKDDLITRRENICKSNEENRRGMK